MTQLHGKDVTKKGIEVADRWMNRSRREKEERAQRIKKKERKW